MINYIMNKDEWKYCPICGNGLLIVEDDNSNKRCVEHGRVL